MFLNIIPIFLTPTDSPVLTPNYQKSIFAPTFIPNGQYITPTFVQYCLFFAPTLVCYPLYLVSIEVAFCEFYFFLLTLWVFLNFLTYE